MSIIIQTVRIVMLPAIITCLNNRHSCVAQIMHQLTFIRIPALWHPRETKSGGPDDSHITPGGSSGNGAYSLQIVKLVK